MYPNPTLSEITIVDIAGSTIQIHDMLGKIMMSKRILTNNETVDLSSFSQGVYFMQIFNLDDVKIVKIIKQ